MAAERPAMATTLRCATLLIVSISAACSPAALPLAADHPGRSTAPSGRLAGPPAALSSAGAPIAAPPAAPAADEHVHGEHVHGAPTATPEHTP